MNTMSRQQIMNVFLTIITILISIILANYSFPIIYRLISKVLHILTPFIIGFFIAFLLHTIVDRLEERGLHRSVAVLFVFLLFLIILAYIISSFVPIVVSQVRELSERLPQFYSDLEIYITEFWTRFSFIPEKYKFTLHDIEDWTQNNLINVNFSRSRINSLLDSFNILVLTPIITYYFLYDYNNIKNRFKRFLVRKKYKFIYKFFNELDDGIGAYFRGLLLILNLITLMSTILFMIFDLEYPLLFGFIVGYTNIIPIIGPYIGGIPAVLFALTHSIQQAIVVTIIVIVMQIIESNIITPYIQSRSIDAHPLLILLAFVAFGKLFGFVGMVLAIPLLYIIILITRYIRLYIKLKKYKNQLNNVYKS